MEEGVDFAREIGVLIVVPGDVGQASNGFFQVEDFLSLPKVDAPFELVFVEPGEQFVDLLF